jgi:hypothetical protein
MTESQIAGALARFHKAVGTIHKNSKAQYGNFASLADVLSAISGPLSESGLAVTQTFIPAESCTLLRTTIRHTGGEVVESDVPLIEVKGRNALHDWGGAVTYQRRFALLAALNLAPGMEEDTDGDSADDKPAPAPSKAPASKAVKAAPTPTQDAAKPQGSAPATPSVVPPIDPAERKEILNLVQEMMKSNRTAFDRFVAEYKAAFNVPADTKISDHFQEQQHAEFAQQFFASLPPS